MKATTLFLAAAFALGTTAAFAQTTPSTTTSGSNMSGTMNQAPSSGTMNNGKMSGNGTMSNGRTSSSDRATMRANRRMNKGAKMKSKTTADGSMKSTM